MIRVEVVYLAQLRAAAGRPGDEFDLPAAATLAHLVAAVAGRHAALRGALLTADGRPRPSLLAFVGEGQVGPDTPLGEGQQVTLVTPVAGGGGGA